MAFLERQFWEEIKIESFIKKKKSSLKTDLLIKLPEFILVRVSVTSQEKVRID